MPVIHDARVEVAIADMTENTGKEPKTIKFLF